MTHSKEYITAEERKGYMNPKQAEILIIEDNPEDVRLIIEAFKNSGLRIKFNIISDGEEAISYLFHRGNHSKSMRPDFILLELKLPKKSGLEVLSEIKSTPELQVTPVVVLTSAKSEDEIYKSYDLSANCCIEKPSDPETFQEVVKTIGGFWLNTATLPLKV
ncbi:MAG: response regulator [Ignavibacteria bacterium]